ncbi:DUF885 family protein, partial [Micromonospora sp. TSRI0369]|uniref:DUF885 family protein n=1 Tax=Micromonospora sp. TSRI0369 TaxID=1703936 RepID=UPI000B228307
RLGMLDGQALRAARVVVDIGMHLELEIPKDNPFGFHPGERWTPELGWEFMRAHCRVPDENLRFEIATALQESKLENLGHLGDRNDHDSQGLFQQRPSSGWGTVEQITDPEYSTTAFLKGLKQVDGWQDMPLTKAAQTVQVSAYPDHYAQWEQQAADLVAEHWNK